MGLKDENRHPSWVPDKITARITNLALTRLFVATGRKTVDEAVSIFATFYNETD